MKLSSSIKLVLAAIGLFSSLYLTGLLVAVGREYRAREELSKISAIVENYDIKCEKGYKSSGFGRSWTVNSGIYVHSNDGSYIFVEYGFEDKIYPFMKYFSRLKSITEECQRVK